MSIDGAGNVAQRMAAHIAKSGGIGQFANAYAV